MQLVMAQDKPNPGTLVQQIDGFVKKDIPAGPGRVLLAAGWQASQMARWSSPTSPVEETFYNEQKIILLSADCTFTSSESWYFLAKT
jgi:hypothetical protein